MLNNDYEGAVVMLPCFSRLVVKAVTHIMRENFPAVQSVFHGIYDPDADTVELHFIMQSPVLVSEWQAKFQAVINELEK